MEKNQDQQLNGENGPGTIAVKAGEAARKGLALTVMTSKGLKSRRIGTEKKTEK